MSILKRNSSNPDPAQALNPVALAVKLIAGIITPLEGLADEDKAFAAAEITWLFHAVKNFQELSQTVQSRLDQERAEVRASIKQEEEVLMQKIGPAGRFTLGKKQKLETERLDVAKANLWQVAVAQSPVVAKSIPDDTERTADTNKLIGGFSLFDLESWERDIAATLGLISTHFKGLEQLLDRAVQLGPAASGEMALQNQIKSRRISILQNTQKIADTFSQAYGVEITSPGQLAGWLAEN